MSGRIGYCKARKVTRRFEWKFCELGLLSLVNMDQNELEECFHQLLALIPVVKDAEPLEEILTNLDVDFKAEAGNMKALARMLLRHVNGDAFDNDPNREGLILRSLQGLKEHLGLEQPKKDRTSLANRTLPQTPHKHSPKMPALEDSPVRKFSGRGVDPLDSEEGSGKGSKKFSGKGRKPLGSDKDSEEDSSETSNSSDDEDGSSSDSAAESHLFKKKSSKKKKKSSPRFKGTTPPVIPSMRFPKEFKIKGTIGEKDEKGKLTYASIIHQIDSAMDLGFHETEVVTAVIHAITPGSIIRTLLEGKRGLTIPQLKSHLKSHFGEKDVTSVYNQMTSAVQGTGEKDTPTAFVMSMMTLRDRVLELSAHKKSDQRRYAPKLVQAEMQKSIYGGLRDEDVRLDLKRILKKKNLPDERLLDEVMAATLSKEEHDRKLGGAAKPKDKRLQVNNVNSEPPKTPAPKKTTGKGGPPGAEGAAGMDPFIAQLSSVIGLQIQDAVAPIRDHQDHMQAQLNELVDAKAYNFTPTQPLQIKTSGDGALNPAATTFSTPATPIASNKTSDGASTPVPTSNTGTLTPTVTTVTSGTQQWQDMLLGALQEIASNPYARNRPGSFSSGATNSGNSNTVNANNGPLDGNYRKRCSICRLANALSCNHCLCCHAVNHRTTNCPKKNDPNWTPLN